MFIFNASVYQERPWTLRRPEFEWFELMLADDSRTRYWKEHLENEKRNFSFDW